VSLISEALRKARQQAAEDGNQRRGILYSWSPGARPRGTRLGLGLVLGAVIALGAALAGAGAVWWVVGHRAPSEASAQQFLPDPGTPGASSGDQSTAAPLPDTMETSPDTVTVAPAPQPGADDRESPTQRNDLIAETPSDASLATLSAHPQSPPSIDPGSTARQTARPGLDHADTVTLGPNGERIFLIEADLGRVTLTLDFVVFRPDDPFAEINGLEVHVGSKIEGFTVEAIERNQVLLRD
jgi:hypothetical protein